METTRTDRAARYDTSRYQGATGLNWYLSDPSLQFLMRYYLSPEELAFVEPRLERLGALMGGPVSERAEETDRNPPRLERYDRWGHDVSRIVLPESFLENRRAVLEAGFGRPQVQAEAKAAGVRLNAPAAAWSYLLDQAEIGMACAVGTGSDMVRELVARYAPADVRDKVLAKFASGEWDGETAQSLTERTGGSDLAELETTATRDGDAWLLNGFKWFVSNANGQAYVVLAKPDGASDDIRGICSFLVLRERRDGTPNGLHIRRLKDKLGTKAVASAEVELVDAEAFLLSSDAPALGDDAAERQSVGDGKGLTRMMAMTNGARLGIAMMGLGCARRALVEALLYAQARTAFGRPLADQPLMRRKLAELIVDVEAVQALVFDGFGLKNHMQSAPARLRIGAPVVKLQAARLGITAASDAIEVHGGNGYVETWPVARILRDAQVNTIWEGPDNILCLDVKRGIHREGADTPFLARLAEAAANGGDDPTAALVADRVADLARAIEAWKRLDESDPQTAEARLFPLTQFMGEVYAGALLVEQAAWERRETGADRKSLVAALYATRHLAPADPLRGIATPEGGDLSRFDELVAGALTPVLA